MSADVIPTRIVPCPTCGGDSIYSPTNAYRPFCSARCKGIDFGAWASEDFKVPEDTPPDSQLSGDDRWMQ